MSDRSTDEHFLRRALDLARQGIGLAAPNPYVGAIITDPQGNVAGTSTYTYAGVKHAEVLALEQAGEKGRGGTLYINLEPHAHQGRTPPCTGALIAAGVRRVVACMADPNPKVSGLGFEKLRAAGIDVEVGGLETVARKLNEAFARYIRHGVPLVTLKSAMTLDGKIAPPPGFESNQVTGTPPGGWITGELARANVHEQRHQSDAILAGIGTILADDPLLTDRSGLLRRRPLMRVILDSRLRLPLESRLVSSVNNESGSNGDVLVFCSSGAKEKKTELKARGIQIEEIAASDGRLDLNAIMQRLGQLEITRVMIEGGASVNAATLSSGIVDKVFLYYAPKIMASSDAVPFINSGEIMQQNNPLRLKNIHLHRFGEDVAIEGYLRDPYSE
ncbi:MAG TPA: bifunctional diaminohydroxyphosphoribosylaminopyrimidine deaminase/5-amino-6-(5-phosphoribosylamino)uracil reductase RibD [Candidatus Aquilonibacter sp.]|jgi:diaminohydroxyphosphoribosylaminopyrimidine deaminase/5-amino-6-(5-phosphoribosylamino)uracil reductase|nr:bifunctional diaminohydroxyphosphoribosylaminopyrimidine deaminase/5-amino-6-(5-phosphoribosylamino)uracil reductase RibD [Candidatus Aquilonibacter sp.]